MGRTSTVLVLALLFAAADAHAFDRCQRLTSDPQWLKDVSDSALARTPVKYHDLAIQIRILPSDTDRLLSPQAIDVAGVKALVIAPTFVTVLCKVALAMYMSFEGKEEFALAIPAFLAAKCFDEGGSQRKCLVSFADDLTAKYRTAFAKLEEGSQNTAYRIASDALTQIVLHEYAHHYLRHRDRIQVGALARADAEFEADFLAVMSSVQAGDAPSAMYYFFGALADVERLSKALKTSNYESAACRAQNVENVVGALGIVPMAMIEVASGGRNKNLRDPRASIKFASSHFAKPFAPDGTCGKLAPATLDQTFAELKQLYARFTPDVETMLNIGTADSRRVYVLLSDLSAMTRSATTLKGLISKIASLVLRTRGLSDGDLSPIVGAVDDAVANEFLSGDFGRLLQMQGLAIVQDRVDLRPEVRLSQGLQLLERAVFFNPELAEAWMNLALLRFKVGDCDAAAHAAARAARTLNTDEQRRSATEVGAIVSRWKGNRPACAAQGAAFHPYPGL